MEEGKEPEEPTIEIRRDRLVERNREIKEMDVSDEEARKLMKKAMEESGLYKIDEDGLLEPIDDEDEANS